MRSERPWKSAARVKSRGDFEMDRGREPPLHTAHRTRQDAQRATHNSRPTTRDSDERQRSPFRSHSPRLLLLLLVLLGLVSLSLSGCLQDDLTLADMPASVFTTIDFLQPDPPLPAPALIPPPDLVDNTPFGLRAHIVETGLEPRSNDSALVSARGDVTVFTRRIGPGFFVVRGRHYDIGYGPVDIDSPGGKFSPTFLRPFDGEFHRFLNPGIDPFPPFPPEAIIFPKGVRLLAKQPGRAKFVFFTDDQVGSLGQGRVEGRGNDSDFPVVISVFVALLFNRPGQNDFGGRFFTRNLVELIDDGSQFDLDPDPFTDPNNLVSGDERAGDRVFTRYVHNLPPGDMRYFFVVNESPLPVRDPYEEGSTRVRIVEQDAVNEITASVITVK